MRQAIRLAFAMQRLELRLLLAAVLLVSVAALGIAWQTRVLREAQLACLESAPPAVEGSVQSPCAEQDEPLAMLDRVSAFAKMGVIFTPIVLGLFLGVPLVAREIETRTAPLAWSLSRSRRRWLLQRAVPVFGVIALACIAVGVAGDVLAHAPPWVEGSDPGFEDWWARGPQVAVRGVAIAAAGMAIGAIVGRQLPALLLGGVATLALFVAVTLVDDALMRSAVEPIAVGPNQLVTGKIYGSGFRQDASGRLLSDEEGYALFGDQLDESGYPPPGYSMVYYLVPSRRYGEFAVYDAAMFGTVAAAGMALAFWIVVRRRP